MYPLFFVSPRNQGKHYQVLMKKCVLNYSELILEVNSNFPDLDKRDSV